MVLNGTPPAGQHVHKKILHLNYPDVGLVECQYCFRHSNINLMYLCVLLVGFIFL